MPLTAALVLTLAFQTRITPEVTAARALAKSAENFAEQNMQRKKMFMLRNQKTWVAMKTEADHLKDEMWRDDVGLVAFNWIKDGKTLIVSFTGGSPSGDWSTHKLSTYRPDGSLARSLYRYAAFMLGGRILEEESIFSKQGKKVFSQFVLMDMKGRRLKNASEQKQMLGFRPALKDYLKASQLPFPK